MGSVPLAERAVDRRILPWHLLATALQSSGTAALLLMPVLARLRFDAGDWQTTLVTAASQTLLICSIFWNALLPRMSIRSYLALHWLTAVAPTALIAFATDFWHLLLWHVIASIGLAGWMPVTGKLMERFYPASVRGRVFGLLMIATQLGSMLTAYAAGAWLKYDGEAFRIILPITALLQGSGLAILAWLGRTPRSDAPPAAATRLRWSNLFAPLLHMREVLRGDRAFYRYEQAFMTYGVGWMIGHALLPVLVTTGLGLNYQQIAVSTIVTYQVMLMLAIVPMGWLLDRVGPARATAYAFAGLALYPIALMGASDPLTLALASGYYGLAMAGVQQGWLLGPVALAPRPERVADYVAIHATLVGIRGTLAQALGMALYRLTGGFAWPLAIASLAFAGAAWQMAALHQMLRTRAAQAPAPDTARENAAAAPTIT